MGFNSIVSFIYQKKSLCKFESHGKENVTLYDISGVIMVIEIGKILLSDNRDGAERPGL